MGSTVKFILQQFAAKKGLPIPATFQGTQDAQALQLLALMNDIVLDLITRKKWQANTVECLFNSTASPDQGDIYALCDQGYMGINFQTMFDRTTHLPVTGGMDGSEWQQVQALQITGPYYRFRLRGNHLLVSPNFPDGHQIAFEYFSSLFVIDGVTGERKRYFTLDTDTFALDESILLAWIAWRWKSEKGLEYAEDFRLYEAALGMLKQSENSPEAVDLSKRTARGMAGAGIVIPLGNWNLP